MKSKITYFLIAGTVLFTSCSSYITQTGKASYYGNEFEGRKTASGEKYYHSKLTAAHRTLPMGTKVKVKNLTTGQTVKVTVNDRGPFAAGRVIDLSLSAAKQINMVKAGTVPVEIKYKKSKRKKR